MSKRIAFNVAVVIVSLAALGWFLLEPVIEKRIAANLAVQEEIAAQVIMDYAEGSSITFTGSLTIDSNGGMQFSAPQTGSAYIEAE